MVSNILAIVGVGLGATSTLSAMDAIPGVEGLGADQFKVLAQPSIDFIPIQTESITVERSADVAESLVIANSSDNKAYVSDNIVPHPRKWTINGYLTPMLPIVDDFFYMKPTLILQKAVLDGMAKDRQKHILKTETCELVNVLISRYSLEQQSTYNNAYRINLECTELVVLEGAMTMMEEAEMLLDRTWIESFEVWTPILMGAITATSLTIGLVNDIIQAVARNENNNSKSSSKNDSITTATELTDEEKNTAALKNWIATGDITGFTSPGAANLYIMQYFRCTDSFIGTAYYGTISSPDIPPDNPVAVQNVQCGQHAFTVTFTWDMEAQREYDEALQERVTFLSSNSIWGTTYSDIQANLETERPNLAFVEYLVSVEQDLLLGTFSDWDGLIAKCNSFKTRTITIDLSGIVTAATAHNVNGTYDAVRARYSELNNYAIDLSTKLRTISDIEEHVLIDEHLLKWIATVKSDFEGDVLRTTNLLPNAKQFPNDDYYSMYFISSKERIGLNDLGFVSILFEVM